MPDNYACNPRNNMPGTVSCIDGEYDENLIDKIEIDFKQNEANV